MNFMKKVLLLAISFLIIYSCDHTPIVTSEELDDSLTLLIKAHSPTASKDYFVMPESIDLHHLPNQDKKNSINEAKVRLVINNPNSETIENLKVKDIECEILNQEYSEGKTTLEIRLYNPIRYLSKYSILSLSTK